MVQRRRRIKQRASESSAGAEKLFRVAGFFIVIVALWLLFVVLRGFFSREEPEEEIPVLPVVVDVLNGCGVEGIAAQMTDFLRANDFDVFDMRNADNASYAETIIIERDSIGQPAAKISDLTDIKNITFDYQTESTVKVTIILGKDYGRFKPFRQ